jgi:hypothetical protein
LNKEEIGIILDKSCNEINKYDEYIILHIELKKGNIQYIKDWFIYADKQFSAMQKTTAFTLASCADLMARNLILDKVCSYSSVIPYFKEFNDNLKKLGLNLTF